MRILRAEWTKLRSVRSTWLTAGSTLLATAAISLLGVFGLTADWRADLPDGWDPTAIGFKGLLVGQLLMAMLGASVITSEYSTGMIVGSLSIVPRRSHLLAAKAGALALIALPTAILTVAVTFGASQLAIAGGGIQAASLGDPGVLGAVLGAVAYLTLIAFLGLAFGVITRSSTGTLGIIVVVALLVPALTPALSGQVGEAIGTYWPTSAGQAAYAVIQTGSVSPWVGGVVLGLFTLYSTVASHLALRRRDA